MTTLGIGIGVGVDAAQYPGRPGPTPTANDLVDDEIAGNLLVDDEGTPNQLVDNE